MKFSDVISWVPSGLVEVDDKSPVGTGVLTLGCPDAFSEIRVGFANARGEAFSLARVRASASSQWGDYVNPVGGKWVDIPFSLSEPSASQAQYDQIVIQGAHGDEPGAKPKEAVKWTWSDWAKLPSVEPDRDTGLHILTIRYLISKRNQYITFMKGLFQTYTGCRVENYGFDYFIGGINNGQDFVTTPSQMDRATAAVNGLVNGSIIAGVQFRTRNRGIVGLIGGDSHFDGTGTKTHFNNFLAQMTHRLGAQFKNGIPFGYVNCAYGGAQAAGIFATIKTLTTLVDPSFVVLPSWTANDLASHEANLQFAILLDDAISRCSSSGCLPIVMTPFPRDPETMRDQRLLQWRRRRDYVLSLRNGGVLVVDASSLLGAKDENGELTGLYKSSLTNDSVHPNDQGHEVLSVALEAAVVGDLIRDNLHPSGFLPWLRHPIARQNARLYSPPVLSGVGDDSLLFKRVEKLVGRPISKFAAKFESLGNNCEFGFVQRRCGAEPIGLFRFSNPVPEALLRGITQGFADIGDNARVALDQQQPKREWIVEELEYGLRQHTFFWEGDIDEEKITAQQLRRFGFLRRKFLEDVQLGTKIFVLHSTPNWSIHIVTAIARALRRLGPTWLLWVITGETCGSVEIVEDGLMCGTIDRLLPNAGDVSGLSLSGWLDILTGAWVMLEALREPIVAQIDEELIATPS
jgi:hypothetical protein